MAEFCPRTTPLIVGASGIVAAMNALEASESAPVPIAFVAATRAGVAVAVAERAHGDRGGRARVRLRRAAVARRAGRGVARDRIAAVAVRGERDVDRVQAQGDRGERRRVRHGRGDEARRSRGRDAVAECVRHDRRAGVGGAVREGGHRDGRGGARYRLRRTAVARRAGRGVAGDRAAARAVRRDRDDRGVVAACDAGDPRRGRRRSRDERTGSDRRRAVADRVGRDDGARVGATVRQRRDVERRADAGLRPRRTTGARRTVTL